MGAGAAEEAEGVGDSRVADCDWVRHVGHVELYNAKIKGFGATSRQSGRNNGKDLTLEEEVPLRRRWHFD